MTRSAKIVLGIILFLILFILLYITKEWGRLPFNKSSKETQIVETFSPETFCFSREQKATQTEPYEVSEKISIVIRGNSVSGLKKGFQSGSDMTNGYEGQLSGTIIGDKMNLIFSYNIEGSEGKELEIYTFNDQVLKKHRYVLKEEDSILVPDVSTQEVVILYKKSSCD